MAIARVDLADLQQTIPVVDSGGLPTPSFLRYLNTVIRSLKSGVNSLIDVQNAVDAANAAVVVAQAAADTAIAAAATAQATADAIVVPPTGAQTITSDYDVAAGDSLILVDATGGVVVVTLLPATALYPVTIKKIDASVHGVTVMANVGDTINGSPTISLTTQYAAAICTSNGATEWFA